MNIFSLKGLRSWFGGSNTARAMEHRGQGDVYVTRLVECMNYCKKHPNSSKCENFLLQG